MLGTKVLNSVHLPKVNTEIELSKASLDNRGRYSCEGKTSYGDNFIAYAAVTISGKIVMVRVFFLHFDGL